MHLSFRSRPGLAIGVAAFAAVALTAPPFLSRASAQGAYLSQEHLSLQSARNVDPVKQTAVLQLYKGKHAGATVWFILTDASDVGVARDLNIMYAPKLANMSIGCPKCVQTVTLEPVPKDNKFAPARFDFPGAPDFSPTRVWNQGAKGFPPEKFQPGSVGDADYSPFVRIAGSPVVYNAPIVATGDGPFDFVHHTNTQDHVVAIDPKTDYDKDGPTVTMALAHGFDSGKPILYLSTEASDAMAATLERATFVPLLAQAPFTGGDDFPGSARERIFAVANGPRANQATAFDKDATDGQPQGFVYASLDGNLSEDITPANTADIRTSNNIQGDFPLRDELRHAFSYSPLWEAQVGEWTPAAIAQGKVKQLNDENQMLEVVKSGLMTGPMGAKFGSAGFVINCPPVAYLDGAPLKDTSETEYQQLP